METMVPAEIWTVARTEQGNAVLIRPIGAEVAVPIFIGQLETQSILIGFGGVPMPRPLTHDLLLNLLHRFGAALMRVELNELRDGIFYARLVLGVKGEEVVVDARPSDSIALAVREKCPVFIAESVVDTAGISIDMIVETAATNEQPETDRREVLSAELEKAVANEEYERAAAIRDLLKALDKEEGKQ